ncbi:fasciclin domain-containing protein [Catellatospora sp. KI3]|uniref:fasciclin domain-containing protein n=1 Tax=Catellatospora sp. KI3 TaxID=3041620 RepID=UPI00248256D5|nr:fasciclin domain-containing protein [Catellatospora sp. KI3]MDI1462788.1 fasciclin domain-containing protein [Catellatospora sp. KI3]
MYGKKKLTAAASLVALSLALAMAACGGSENMTTPQARQSETGMPMMSPSMGMMSPGASMGPGGTFGTGCAALPTDPAMAGSMEQMAQQPLASAAAGNPQLSTLVAAITKAGLADTLNSAPELTVFAPSNEAFSQVPKADLDRVMADPELLKKVLTYHVVAGTLAPDQLDGSHKTVEGQDLKVSGSGTDFKVNDTATITCGNIKTKNGTVYILDGVLMPPA